ncbi:MAG: hypothetical protein ACW975_03815 [Candidatus Thorarchaeota archaeon]
MVETRPTIHCFYAKVLFRVVQVEMIVQVMEEESKFRVEAPEQEEKEKTGLLRPLPESTRETTTREGKVEPIVKVIGISMTERRSDLLLIILMPLLAGLIDAYFYSEITVLRIDVTGLGIFVIPMIAAIPIGLVVESTSRSLVAALLAPFFFVVFFLLFLVSPALIWPAFELGQFFVNGLVVAGVYFLLVVLASLLGVLIGALVREFL